MPRIPDSHLQSVIFVYPSEQTARDGDQVGGSGFVVNYPSGVSDWRIRYVVTNQHTIDLGGHWVRLNRVGGTHIVHIPPQDWTLAPEGDDFAIATLSLPPSVAPYEIPLDGDLTGTRQALVELGIGPGDEAYMVGRFVAHGGRTTNNPIARFGNIALMPNPDELVLDGRRREVEAYLVEMRSHSGFSGSPVFVLIPQFSFRGVIGDTSKEDNQTKFRLIGIDTGHMIDYLPIEERDDAGWERIERLRAIHLTDVSIIAPVWKVTDLLDRKDLAQERRRLGLELEKHRGSERAVSDQSISATTSSPVRT